MSDLFGNHIVGFPTRRLKYKESLGEGGTVTIDCYMDNCAGNNKNNAVIWYVHLGTVQVKTRTQSYIVTVDSEIFART